MKKEINQLVKDALLAYQKNNNLTLPNLTWDIEFTKNSKFGDYSCNIAMKLSPLLKMNPVGVANDFKELIKSEIFEKIEVAAPGFLNFYLNLNFLAEQVKNINKSKKNFGKNKLGEGKKVQVEFISANPTGPLTLANGRNGFFGDCLASVLNYSGYKVKREYYINDRGNQIDILGESVIRRYLQNEGVNVDFPEELYKGEYIKDLAKKIKLKDFKLKSVAEIQKVKSEIKEWALQEMLTNIKTIAEKSGIHYDIWFSEQSLYQGSLKEELWKLLSDKNLLYKEKDAWWFKSSAYGDEKDRVVVKKDGEPTYFFSDILYLYNRFITRKFDEVIVILGCDHHGIIKRWLPILNILESKGKLHILLYQLVRLIFNGQELKMSKRKGTYVTLDELIDDVGLDVVRWFFLMYQMNTQMDFDLNLAKKKSDQNPVYYVQYAHARICSIIAKLSKFEIKNSKSLEYNNSVELELIKELIKFPDLVEEMAVSYEINKLPNYILGVAKKFHKFYTECRVIDNDEVNQSRLALIKAVQIVIANALTIMGISAPEKM